MPLLLPKRTRRPLETAYGECSGLHTRRKGSGETRESRSMHGERRWREQLCWFFKQLMFPLPSCAAIQSALTLFPWLLSIGRTATPAVASPCSTRQRTSFFALEDYVIWQVSRR